MRTKTILVCADELHAEVVDQLVACRLRDECGTICTGWSGVYTDGEQFGILWASPVSELFGVPEDFPELALVEDTEGAWLPVPPPEPDESEVV